MEEEEEGGTRREIRNVCCATGAAENGEGDREDREDLSILGG